MNKKQKTPRNKTITLCNEEIDFYSKKLITLNKKCKTADILNKTINQDFFEVVNFLPDNFVDLLIIDPPYNLNKSFNKLKFSKIPVAEYSDWIDKIIQKLIPTLKPTATIYFCGEWNSSASIFPVLDKHFKVRNRITWEREKGRGAKSNWKNNSEDIWYGTYTDDFVFNVEDVKLKRKVLAPYRDENGTPKDWNENKEGGFRLTFPSNIWTDISVPFWSMPENTDHPTQKPEKLFAKIILASSDKDQIVFDPFAGSGTTAVVSKKLGRYFVGIEVDKNYACLIEKRLNLADSDKSIQGYEDNVFWERNTLSERGKIKSKSSKTMQNGFITNFKD